MKSRITRRFRMVAMAGILTAICVTTAAQAFFPPPPPPTGVSGGEVPPPANPPPVVVPQPPPDPFIPPPPTTPPPDTCTGPPVTPQNTPEPASLVMGLVGLMVAGGYAARRRFRK